MVGFPLFLSLSFVFLSMELVCSFALESIYRLFVFPEAQVHPTRGAPMQAGRATGPDNLMLRTNRMCKESHILMVWHGYGTHP